MSAGAGRRLKKEVESWAAETRLLIGACRVLIGYFGKKGELRSWDAATKEPLRWVSLVVAHFSSKARGEKATPPFRAGRAFRCSESTARIVASPSVSTNPRPEGRKWLHRGGRHRE
jgi:hypothetical protein